MTDPQPDYWRQRLAGLEPLELPTDLRRRVKRTGLTAQFAFEVPAELLAAARRLAEERGTDLACVWLTAYQILLGAYCRQQDVAVGVRLDGGDGVVALADLAPDPAAGELLKQLAGSLREALDHPAPDWDLALGDLQAAVPPLRAWFTDVATLDAVAYEIALSTGLDGDRCEARISYDSSLFNPATIERMAGHWLHLLAAAVSGPDRRISELDLVGEAERRELLAEWGVAPAAYPADRGVAELFAEQVAVRPDAVAVEAGTESVTYRQLDDRAERLARLLRSRGVGPEVLVALCLERGPDLIVGLLAVVKAGGAYVPLDPDFPAERLEFVLRDTAAPLVLTQTHLRDRVPAADEALIFVDAEFDAEFDIESDTSAEPEPGRDAPAYVLYTSGSTGTPKGVVVTRPALLNLLYAMRDIFPLRPGDAVLFATSITFDIANVEVLLPLVTGGRIVLASKDQVHSPSSLVELIDRHHVVLAQATPSAWRPLVEALAAAPGERELQIFTAGEALPAELAKAMLGVATRVVNGYGPTETTVYATVAEVRNPDAGVTIGRPTANTELYVVDPSDRPVPVGVPGELLIGGAGVARGYLNRPELTAERFVAHPFSEDPSALVYRTGDLVRWRPGGELEFLGRLDDQVKVRGFRIEPGEIEATLSANPDVASCVVVVREDVPGERALVAYCVPVAGRTLGVSALREWCGRGLPGYLVPTGFVFLSELPLTTSGKVDRKALPAPEGDRSGLEAEFVAPRTPAERAVARIWAEALWVDEVGAHDDFFDLGGDSLIATRVALSLGRDLGLEVPVKALFARPTVAGLAELLTTARRNGGVFDRAILEGAGA